MRKHDVNRFKREIEEALKIAPRFAEAYVLMADEEVSAHRYDVALQDALQAQQIEPDAAWVSLLIATAYNSLERYDQASLILSNMRAQDTAAWQAKYERARAEVGRKNVESALHWSELALKEAPSSFTETHLLRANALQIAQRWKEASDQMESYLAAPTPHDRAQVEAALVFTRRRAEEQERGLLAGR
ncbi:MAG TPA: hypothetical protein VGD62_08795 [Acidobacteriaceae bacterium]